MAEDATFSGFSSGDAAQSFAKVVSKIKSDMAAIEASAKNIERSLSKAAKNNIAGGAGNTGASKSAYGSSSLGSISSPGGGGGGMGGKGTMAALGIGGLMGGMGIGGSQGAIAGGLAVAGLPDLIMRPEQALDMEAARFGTAQATGDFGTFNRMMGQAKNSFNVQNQEAFQNTIVYGTQRAGMVGLNGGGTVGERRAASQIGGYNTLAGLAGIDQGAVPGVMKTMLSSETYYSSMASGRMTRNPVTGETLGIESQVNQGWKSAGLQGMSQEKALSQIDINYGEGSAGRRSLLNDMGGDENAVDMYIEGLRIRARQGGKELTENQVQDQMKDVGAAGGLGTEKTQGMEGTRALEGAKTGLNMETLDAATAGIEEATKHITNAVDMLAQLEGPLKTMLDAYVTMANQMDTFNTELPGATKGVTDFFSSLPGMLMSFLAGKSAGGGLLSRLGGGLLRQGGKMLLRQGLMAGGRALVMNPVGATVAAVAVAGYAAHKWGRPGDETTKAWAEGKAQPPGYLTGDYGTSSTAGSGGYGGAQSSSSGYGRAKGDWFVEADQDDRIHYGEMVLPNRVATAVRKELAVGKTAGQRATSKGDGTTVNIYLTVQRASDQEAMYFANKVKKIIDGDRELMAIGAGRFGGN